uniref:Endonuclease/exonuclease/phosphatase domain-containing protein n=1 Tax=Cacopsylla melanoneura TaxID=428564 RepID=A0A8D9F8E3_9HEMI
MILSETYYDKVFPYSFQISGFDFYHTKQEINQNSGLAVFIRQNLNIAIKQINIEHANGLELEVYINNKVYVILAFYRTGQSRPEHFIQELDQYLTQIIQNNKYFLIVGDLNINILQTTIEDIGQTYLDMTIEHNFIPCITDPTRLDITYGTETCIDHIMFRPIKPADIEIINTSVLHTTITDHYSTIATLQTTNNSNNDNNNTNQRSTLHTYIDYDVLLPKLEAETWEQIMTCQDVNETANRFTNQLNKLITESIKLKK